MSRDLHRQFKFVVTAIALASCSFSPNVPNGHVVCKSVSDCPSGYTCELVPGVDPAYNVCCKDKGCASSLSPGIDGSADVPTSYDGQSLVSEAGASVDGQPIDSRGLDSGQDIAREAGTMVDSSTTDITAPMLDATGIPDLYDMPDAPKIPDAIISDVWVQADSLEAPSGTTPIADALNIPDVSQPDVFVSDALGTCGSDDDCPTTAPMCLKHLCAACTTNTDCTGNASGDMCNTTSGRCATCLADTDCKDASKPLCGQGKCTACTYATTANGCCADTDCPAHGTGSDVTCNASHQCIYSCVNGYNQCTGGGCVLSGDCCDVSQCPSAGAGQVVTCNNVHKCITTCDPGLKDCNGTCIDQAACCDPAADCPSRSDAVITCSSSHKCVYACNAGATKLGCQCTAGSASACNGPAQKLVVSCVSGVWTDSGTSCGQTQNCDTGTGICVAIPSDCVGHSPGYTFCGPNYTPTVCGPDLTTVVSQTACPGLCSGGTCQTAFCGDGRKESGEECDDGNTIAADGCEPSCHNSTVLSLALGFQHSCALLRDGYVRCWGANDQMQLGLGHKNQEWDRNPYQLTDASGNPYVGPISLGGAVSAIAAGDNHTCAILSSSGAVRCWGANNAGQLGLGNSTDVPAGTLPSGNATVNLGGTAAIAIAAGADVSCAILQSGSVRCWGQNAGGDLGLGNTNTILVPADVPLGATATAIGVGDHACTLLSTPSVRCWGYNGLGELGLSSKTEVSATHPPNDYNPVPFPTSYSPSFLAVGGGHTCVRMTPNNQLQCWGLNASGQLGLGLDPSVASHSAIGDDESPTVGQVITNSQGVSSVVTGGSHTCVIYASDSGLRCWGDNSSAQLGLPNTNNMGTSASTLPNTLDAIKFTGATISSVYAGGWHTCVLLSNGQVRCWGWNSLGQLGLGYLSGTGGTKDYVGGTAGWSPDQVAAVKVFHP